MAKDPVFCHWLTPVHEIRVQGYPFISKKAGFQKAWLPEQAFRNRHSSSVGLTLEKSCNSFVCMVFFSHPDQLLVKLMVIDCIFLLQQSEQIIRYDLRAGSTFFVWSTVACQIAIGLSRGITIRRSINSFSKNRRIASYDQTIADDESDDEWGDTRAMTMHSIINVTYTVQRWCRTAAKSMFNLQNNTMQPVCISISRVAYNLLN